MGLLVGLALLGNEELRRLRKGVMVLPVVEHVGKLSLMASADASRSLAHQGIPSHAGGVGVGRENFPLRFPVELSEGDIFHESP